MPRQPQPQESPTEDMPLPLLGDGQQWGVEKGSAILSQSALLLGSAFSGTVSQFNIQLCPILPLPPFMHSFWRTIFKNSNCNVMSVVPRTAVLMDQRRKRFSGRLISQGWLPGRGGIELLLKDSIKLIY